MSYLVDISDRGFLAAAAWSDDMLDAIAAGWRPPYTTADGEVVWWSTYRRTCRQLGVKPA
jgi:hypothetical protein